MPSSIVGNVNFNCQQDCFTVCTNSGCRVFGTYPPQQLLHLRSSIVGSVKLCTMLHRTNLIAIVAGGTQPKFAENTVMIWDDKAKEFVLEITLSTPVLNVLLSYTRLVSVEAGRIHVFNFPDNFSRILSQTTGCNSMGLAALSNDSKKNEFLVFPDSKPGRVQIMNLQKVSIGSSRTRTAIDAHKSPIARMTLNNPGTLLATASMKGTVIRVFDTEKKQMMYELRRGSDPATINCLRFSPCSSFLAVTSDKGTIHIFATGHGPDGKWSNRSSWLKRAGLNEPARSCVQIPLAIDNETVELGFVPSSGGSGSCQTYRGGSQASLVAVCTNGTYHKFSFTSDGSYSQEAFDYYLELGDDEDFWTTFID
ncbi:hypothetical protein AB6A40_001853 [Gnathostoma spinigerum]|uniref:WD repeat domain phosphoinositide-interacting protein 4 n=1 Tax=Gnathostoma spinigerum TaxID=75299 RepID=A0ABD6EAI7_9BILA